MDFETAQAALTLLEAGEGFALATILSSRGSSPRHADTSMLVRTDGSIAGTVGGGPLEATVIEDSLAVMASGQSRLADYDTAELGMMCGGFGRVLIEAVDPADPTVLNLYRGLVDLFSEGRNGWLVTVAEEKPGDGTAVSRCLVDARGDLWGDSIAPPETLRDLARRGGTYDLLVSGDPSRIHVQAVGARGTAYVFGAGHCAEKIVPLLNTTGFFTVVIDDRSDFANRDRFPTADRILVPESFVGIVRTLPIDENSYIVIVTRGHAYDQSVLEQALATQAGYIGMIGSRKKVADTFQALQGKGVSEKEIARVHAPIGLPIAAETPEEIAVSIAAELIQVRAGKSG